MRLLSRLIVLSLFVGCVTTGKLSLDDRIQDYVKEFYRDFPYATEVVIKPERSIQQRFHGRCLPDVPVAIVNPYSTWSMEDVEVKYLVYHELAHCALDIAHSEDSVVMSSEAFPDKFTNKAVRELEEQHRKACDGEIKSVRKLAFGDDEPKHLSCYIRDSMEYQD